MWHNRHNLAHLWEEDLKSTICGIPKEVCIMPDAGNHAVSFCEDCFHISAGHVRYNPSPAEREFIEAILGA